MPTRGRGRFAPPLWAALALLACGCGDDAPEPGVSTGRGPERDGGGDGGPHAMPSPRPDGGAILPPAEGEVVLAYMGAPARHALELEAEPGRLDVHLSIDTSGSIGHEIDALQRDLGRVTRALREQVAEVSFGVSRFEDFPRAPFGAEAEGGRRADTPFRLLTPITSDEARVASAVASLDQPLGHGGDAPESGAEALWQIATGAGYEAGGKTYIEPFPGRAARGGGTIGGVGFREGALRVVLHVTDAPSHAPSDYQPHFPDTHTMQDAAEALAEIEAHVVAIVSGACDDEELDEDCDPRLHQLARHELQQVAYHTGAHGPADEAGLCPYGLRGKRLPPLGGKCPLVFDVNAAGAGLSDALTEGIVHLVDAVRFDVVTGYASDDPLHFVERVIPISAEAGSGGDGAEAELADLLPEGEPDGEPDSFVHVRSRARLRFEVVLRNTRIAPSDVDQVFRVVVQIAGDGLTLAEHILRVRVPAGTGIAPEPSIDAGPQSDAAAGDDEDAGP